MWFGTRLTELLQQARKSDPQLGADLEAEVAALLKRRQFGLVFERHQPEAVELPGRAIRRGDKVPVRGPARDRRRDAGLRDVVTDSQRFPVGITRTSTPTRARSCSGSPTTLRSTSSPGLPA